MVFLSHPTGNANVRNAALALAEADLLAEFWTCLAWDPASRKNRFFPGAVRAQLQRRALAPAVLPFVRTVPWREAGRLLAEKLRLRRCLRHEEGFLSVDAVYGSLDRHVAHRVARAPAAVKAVYAYDDGALESFRAARRQGMRCIFELSAGYWRALHQTLTEEAERQPAWAPTLLGMRDSPAKLARKDEELALADEIVVASSFAKRSLDFAPGLKARVHLLPYGAPAIARAGEKAATGKLRVLYVGSLEQRKGISYLFQALEQVRDAAELTVVGKRAGGECPALDAALVRHRYIPSLPFSELLREYARHDVFLFPSLFDAFGLVILEAMSQGLPVITTPHTAGPDLITAGREGFIVPIRSPEAIAEKLLILAQDRELLQAMSQAAREKAAALTWSHYRERFVAIIAHAIGGIS